MKILQIAPIVQSLPPKKYGGTERVISALTEELVKRGHDVTLLASGNSKTSAKLLATVPESLNKSRIKDPFGLNEQTLYHISYAYQQQHDYDIIHDHLSPLSIPTAGLAQTPTVITLHNSFSENNKKLYQQAKNLNLVTISYAQAKLMPQVQPTTIYNGLSMEDYPFSNRSQNYLLFVGRISMEKGVHFAIEAAKRVHMPIILAAKLNKEDQDYFNQFVKPHLSKNIRWIGEVDEKKRNTLMKKALATLHPVTWPEPFGLSMIESMACGTPVIGFAQGSIPEVIKPGVSGYIVNNVSEMVSAIKKIPTINRYHTRNYALNNFNAKHMADAYEAYYYEVIYKKNAAEDKRIIGTTSSYVSSQLSAPEKFLPS